MIQTSKFALSPSKCLLTAQFTIKHCRSIYLQLPGVSFPRQDLGAHTSPYQYYTLPHSDVTVPIVTLGEDLQNLSLKGKRRGQEDPVTIATQAGRPPTLMDVKRSVKVRSDPLTISYGTYLFQGSSQDPYQCNNTDGSPTQCVLMSQTLFGSYLPTQDAVTPHSNSFTLNLPQVTMNHLISKLGTLIKIDGTS
jgi:hypothetical protein